MENRNDRGDPTDNKSASENLVVSAPTIELPKGGGAIQGIGEKFAANPVTGTGSMSVPIMTSPGRAGFGPDLGLSYDSGSGNGPFGFGWSLSHPSISRKTNKGLPQYLDAEQSDIFLLSGAEDLVAVLNLDKSRFEDSSSVTDYTIHRYRPRIEGLFARIERWTRSDGDVHWRSISKDNILTIYGKDSLSRITDSQDPNRIFSWLISETRDDKGNVIVYQYKPEDGVGVDLSKANERNRGNRTALSRTANRYLKNILYGNRLTLLVDGKRPRFLNQDTIANTEWMFEVVFDYGEHDTDKPNPKDQGDWNYRIDPFSNYRSGFEVRTSRLCQRVLMFHHFETEANLRNNCLVGSTDFSYSHQQDPADVSNPIYTFLKAATQTSHKRKDDNENSDYFKRSLPPVEFEYSQPVVQDSVEEVDPDSLENMPIGVDGSVYRWTDLFGEGIPGILTEQANGWFYKRNISPIGQQPVEFAALERIVNKPNLSLMSGGHFMDLAGDGQPDLVTLDEPSPGFYESDGEEGWQNFQPFTSRVNRTSDDPNLKFIDLDGDGHADLLITEDQAFIWHASLAEQGFAPARRVAQALDEEKGPRIVFADGRQSIYLADLSGDGLTDLVRIRNGEVCYWPNLGYCRFGAKITMDHSPFFDNPDQFQQSRIRLADIDGSGTNDIIYLHRDGVRLYFNQSGNGWSKPQILDIFPRVDELVNIVPADLLGNGTACLVWSSPLPGDSTRPMRYVNLMGDQKPHLLVKTINNLGAETEIQYAPSTKFYLQDKYAGKPWVTKLPFPVHVVERVTVTDKWRKWQFSNNYSYHHGHYDGVEREFRGFGRVDQTDVESFGKFAQGNTASPYISDDQTLYQPPIKTVSWYHTGAFLNRQAMLSHYQDEYFPNWYERLVPDQKNLLGSFQENQLPEPDISSSEMTLEEQREAHRACKGMLLRQETYELDVDALELGEEKPIKLFSCAYHNCHIRMLQGQNNNRYAVFLVTESEAITYNYEMDLQGTTLTPDPRIAHTLNLQLDEFGQSLQSAAVVYPRLGSHDDASLSNDVNKLINQTQKEAHLAYTETRYTNDITEIDNYRLRVPCEVLSYELTGFSPEDQDDLDTTDPRDNLYFTLDELRRFHLSQVHQSVGDAVPEIPYHTVSGGLQAQKRCVEQVRMLYFNQNLNDPLPLGELNALALPYETYTLALTDALMAAVFGNKITPDVRSDLDDEKLSGYVSGTDLSTRFPNEDNSGQYWMRSGIAGFALDAADHFYLAERYSDPFDTITSVQFDPRDLFVVSSTDALGNTGQILAFDYRVLAPSEMQDINGNQSETVFDLLGLPVASAIKGKGNEGDNLNAIILDPGQEDLIDFFTNDYNATAARQYLGNATARHLYYFGEKVELDGSITYGHHPACAAGIIREQHVSALATNQESPLQVGFEYSDAAGSVLVAKGQAEAETAGGPLRWIANGKTLLNNKGKPVKQYEPYFTDSHVFEEPQEVGVTPIIYYDAAGRVVRTESPDGSYSRVDFSPWHVTSYDANDTVLESGNAWYTEHSAATQSAENKRAAQLAAEHANTPATVIFDSLGRDIISITHNRVRNNPTDPWQDEKSITFTKLDAEGKPLWIRDARGNLVMQYISALKPTRVVDEPDPNNPENIPVGTSPCYDIAGNLLCQFSMDGGSRWLINDAAGQPFYTWDENEGSLQNEGTTENETLQLEQRRYFTTYDVLRRPLQQRMQINDGQWQVIERMIYGENHPEALQRNLRGQVFQHYDSSGLITLQQVDFKGNPLKIERQLNSDYEAQVIHWPENPPAAMLEEVYTQNTRFDALNRMVRQENWHIANRTPAIYMPKYNARGALFGETLTVRGQVTEAIVSIQYDAKGQRQSINYGNGTMTRYAYDPKTFRLKQLRTTRAVPDQAFPSLPSNLSNGNILQNLYYTYDPIGNISEIHDDAYEPVFFNNQRVEPRNRYTYDALYRLMKATGRENYHAQTAPKQIENLASPVNFPVTDNALRIYTQSYIYDEVGNIMQMAHEADRGSWTRHYEYASDSNRLLKTWLGDGVINAVNYDYDTHGSMLNLNNTPDEFNLRWNYDDMIHGAHLGGGGQAFYNYGGDKQRTRKRIERIGSRVEERLYLGGMERYRRWDNQVLVEEIETYHLFADEQRVLIVEDVLTTDSINLNVGELFRYQYGNHFGSVGLELDGTASIISYEEYHPYGTAAYRACNVLVKVTAKRYRYTGMERDEESGLNYHGARYLACWLGRWTASDPIGIEDGLNLYFYVDNKPINYHDPSGTLTAEDQVKFDIIADLKNKGLSVVTEVEVYILNSKGARIWDHDKNKWLNGFIDVAYIDPDGNLQFIETKGYFKPSDLTENQVKYLKKLEKGTNGWEIKGHKAESLGYFPGRKGGANYKVFHKGNLGDFSKIMDKYPGGKNKKHVVAKDDASRKPKYEYFDDSDELSRYNDARDKRLGRNTAKKVSKSATEVIENSKKLIKKSERFRKLLKNRLKKSVPIVGDALQLKSAYDNFSEGNYLEGGLEIGGMLPGVAGTFFDVIGTGYAIGKFLLEDESPEEQIPKPKPKPRPKPKVSPKPVPFNPVFTPAKVAPDAFLCC